jgi:hypothetical protein
VPDEVSRLSMMSIVHSHTLNASSLEAENLYVHAFVTDNTPLNLTEKLSALMPFTGVFVHQFADNHPVYNLVILAPANPVVLK